MAKEKKRLIICCGRKDNGKYLKCKYQYIGNWGDNSLREHEKKEMKMDDRRKVFWKGFVEEEWWYVK